ncbi:hypothetical protein Q4553_02505 [Tenacibaculum soleae]|nr:hypothetical protein [Tenacibaculum soleae]MDO6743435.1 hypothetical protein [Tenacibaculum soleae]
MSLKFFNNGDKQCDFTYIDRIAEVIGCFINTVPEQNNGTEAFDIGNS